MLLSRLPDGLEDPDALLKRREKAKQRKDKWRSLYADAYRYAMPHRETFNFQTEGQAKNTTLYDSTLQESTYTAANTLCAQLFPGWTRWAELAPGGNIDKAKITQAILEALASATETFFEFLNNSNFAQAINETALDLMVGTGVLEFHEGDAINPFVFTSIPLGAIELEEGPDGTVETTFMQRCIPARNLLRTYPGLEAIDLSEAIAHKIKMTPDEEVVVIQAKVFNPENKHYYCVVVTEADKRIVWRYDYGESSPTIAVRATKLSGELYGRGRVLLALSNAKTLDKMKEFLLREAALSIGGVFTAVSDGVLNPYTAVLSPGSIIPVASNDNSNPSLRRLDSGGKINLTEMLLENLQQSVRRIMLGPEPTEGAVRSATEVSVNDRNRLWAMNGEYGRIQAELLAKIVARGVFILQRKGLIPKFSVDGREVTVKYTSPFAKSQAAEDALAVQNAMGAVAVTVGPEAASQLIMQSIKVEEIPKFFMKKYGADATLVRTDEEREELVAKTVAAAQSAGALPTQEEGP